MTKDEIREIVKITIEELTARQTKLTYPEILRVMDKRLHTYFRKYNDDKLADLLSYYNSNDPYIDIIYYQYSNGQTIEWIAEHLHKDVSTIKRNKKRIITKMYEELYK